MAKSEKALFRPAEVARVSGLSLTVINNVIARGQLRVKNLIGSKHRLISREALRSFLQEYFPGQPDMLERWERTALAGPFKASGSNAVVKMPLIERQDKTTLAWSNRHLVELGYRPVSCRDPFHGAVVFCNSPHCTRLAVVAYPGLELPPELPCAQRDLNKTQLIIYGAEVDPTQKNGRTRAIWTKQNRISAKRRLALALEQIRVYDMG